MSGLDPRSPVDCSSRSARSRWLVWAALAPLLVGCEDNVEQAPPSSAPPPILIGVLTDTSQSEGASGRAMRPAFDAAVAAVNGAGGIDGRQVQLVFPTGGRDAKGDNLVPLAEEMIAQGVIGILGPVRSSEVLAIKDVIKDAVPLISPSATSNELLAINGADPWVFRTVPNDDLQVNAMVRFAREGVAGVAKSCTRMSVLYQDDAYGTAFKNTLTTELQKKGGQIAGTVVMPQKDTRDYKSLISELAGQMPDCAAMIALDNVGGPFMIDFNAYREQNSGAFAESFFFVGADGLYVDEFLLNSRTDRANPTTTRANGFFGTTPDPSPPDNPSLTEFLKMYDLVVPRDPSDELTSYVAAAYDAAALLLLARAAAGSDVGRDVRDQLVEVSRGGTPVNAGALGEGIRLASSGEDINYTGASGPVDFQPPGMDVRSGYAIWTVEAGKFKVVGKLSVEDVQ